MQQILLNVALTEIAEKKEKKKPWLHLLEGNIYIYIRTSHDCPR